MKITLLGTGTSTGVPHLGCQCKTCISLDSKDKRLRSSCLIEIRNKRILIDCGPDFRQQILNTSLPVSLTAILFTHHHSDHTNGLDDLRPNSAFGLVPLYANKQTAKSLQQRFPYCFEKQKYPGVPSVELHTIEPYSPFYIEDILIQPFTVLHGNLPILAYRIEDLVYITDMKMIPQKSLSYLTGVKGLIINGLRFEEHPTHQSIQDAVNFAQKTTAIWTRITHLNHTIGLHSEVNNTLPSTIQLGYDGEILDL